jgi:ubiquinone/menaquinone biosynthesis C-methylase UbiE
MSRRRADELLGMVGLGRILLFNFNDQALIGSLLQSGCDAYGWVLNSESIEPARNNRICRMIDADAEAVFDTVVINMALPEHTVFTQLIKTLRTNVKRSLLLDFNHVGSLSGYGTTPSTTSNEQLETLVIEAGFRRHLACFPVARYQRLNSTSREMLLAFEKLSDSALTRWPMENLLMNRDLHMDMSREASARSDAHLVRYALAAEWIRPGDKVLDCACGLGYGTAMLAASSTGRHFIGVDIDPQSIAYARDNFADYDTQTVEYRAGSALDLNFIADHSIDMVVTFETIEHLENYPTFLAEIARVLKPDGRVIGSVPHLWVDETGRDPNPHHFHAFDYSLIRDAFARYFTIEARYAQTAPGGVKLHEAQRDLEQRPLDFHDDEADTEWWILVASGNLADSATVEYGHPEFDRSTQNTLAVVTAFEDFYDDPWVYRQLIQNGQRIRDPQLLSRVIDSVAANTRNDSADFGAMLSVRAYQALLDDNHMAQTAVIDAVENYTRIEDVNPHVYRWQLSLSYVAGLILLNSGQRDRAKSLLVRVTELDPLRFSPLLATKTVSANFILGTMHMVDGEIPLARSAFGAGVSAARRALHAPDLNAIGRPEEPLCFGFMELAEIADLAGQCAVAIRDIDQSRVAPGKVWRTLETRRFGMLAWLRTLEEENKRLRQELARVPSEPTIRALLPKRISEVFREILPAMFKRAWSRLLN